jgi:hypothetical protein
MKSEPKFFFCVSIIILLSNIYSSAVNQYLPSLITLFRLVMQSILKRGGSHIGKFLQMRP